jgi:hypothetical protein
MNVMKRNLQMLVLPAAIAAGVFAGCTTPPSITNRIDPTQVSMEKSREGYDTFGRKWEVLSRQTAMLLTYTGTITEIDYPTREVTLKGPGGQLATFVVDKNVQRFDEARVGDQVSIDYFLGVDAQVRPPTDAERAKPLEVLGSTRVRVGSDAAPAGYQARIVRAVVTIEAIDKAAQTVTVKGPRGKTFTARVKDPSRLDKVGIGNTVVMTFTEATAVSLKPVVETRTDSVQVNYTGTIMDIDSTSREMTLLGSNGHMATFYVDKSVQRFNEAKVGDKVSLDYYIGVSAEIRTPTAEEKQNPLVVLDTAGKTGPATAPAAYDVRHIRAVVTIESLDRKAQTVTVKGPRGRYFTTRVADPSRLDRVRVGDNILMTFTEATAVSLKPVTY